MTKKGRLVLWYKAFRDTLQLPNLDQKELEGSLNALTLALALMENLDELLHISG
ncbi:MAG: hypothetical protein ACRBFS_02045 [Aureispira sp.]